MSSIATTTAPAAFAAKTPEILSSNIKTELGVTLYRLMILKNDSGCGFGFFTSSKVIIVSK